MRKFLRIVLIILLLFSLLILVPSATIETYAAIIEYPLDVKEVNPPLFDNYKSDWEYEDPSISIKITKGRLFDTDYLVAKVKIINSTQIRSAMAYKYSSSTTILGSTLAKRMNSALAINGDFFSARRDIGFTCRQGHVYRSRCNGEFDILIIDDKGNLNIIKNAKNEDIANFKGNVINSFTFGPALIIDGVEQSYTPNGSIGSEKAAQRMCLAQTGPLEYLCIVSEGPEDKGSKGMTIAQFSKLVSSFKEIKTAYNLDGGSSCTMVFKDDKINSPNNPKRRPLADIIYFASAYSPDK